MNKRILLLWSCLLVMAATLSAQDAPAGVVTAFKKGNSQELSEYLGDKVDLIIDNRSTNASRKLVGEKINTFFSGNKVRGFAVNHQGKRDESGFFVGTLTTANGNFRVNCFFKKIANKYVIHQIRIDKINE